MAKKYIDENGIRFIGTFLKNLLDKKQNALIFDDNPTLGSTNPVKSNGIKTALNGKAESDHTHETVNGYKIVVSNTAPTVNDINVITFVM